MTQLQPIRPEAETAMLRGFDDFAKSHDWGGKTIMTERVAARDLLQKMGLPSRRVEEWKYTDLRALMPGMPAIAEPPAEAHVSAAGKIKAAIELKDGHKLLFVNGIHSSPLMKEDGVEVYSSARGDKLPDAVTGAFQHDRVHVLNHAVLLNSVYYPDLTIIHVPAKTQLEKPLHLIFRQDGEKALSTFPRVLIVIGEGASATIVESHDGPDGVAYFENAIVDVVAGDDADVKHVRHNDAGDASINLSTLFVRTGKQTKFSSFAMTTGGSVSRHQMFFNLAGADAQLSVQGATLLRGKQHADNTMVADHIKGGCVGRQLFKTVLDDRSRGVFQGLIIVRPDSQKTDGRMMSSALLLGDEAEMDNKPELEIFADDVQCGHGATVGALDESLLFYLRARGIPRKEAESLLIQSFVGDAIQHIENEQVRDALLQRAGEWLDGRG